jgi:hypothetical protein
MRQQKPAGESVDSLDVLLYQLLSDPSSNVCQLRKMLSNHTRLQDIVSFYYQTSPILLRHPLSAAAGSNQSSSNDSYRLVQVIEDMLRQSMYALPIQHFLQAAGKNKVLLVLREEFQSAYRAQRVKTMHQVLYFLNVPLADQLVPPRRSSPFQHVSEAQRGKGQGQGQGLTLSQDMYCKLQLFFEPFNALLINVSSLLSQRLNFTLWEEDSLQDHFLRGLPQFVPQNGNISWPLLWFEIDDQQRVSSSVGKALSHRLVPQRLVSL